MIDFRKVARTRKVIVAVVSILGIASLRYAYVAGATQSASTLNPEAIKIVLPSNIDWHPAAGLTGTDVAYLVGEPSKPGFYVQLNRFRPGNFSRPHYHPNDRYIMVVSGTWWVGTGSKFEPETATVPMKPGAFVTHPGRKVHYDGARKGNEEAIVMIFGQGPGSRIECEGASAEKGPGPCEDARRAMSAQ